MKVIYTKIAGKQFWRISFTGLDSKLAQDIRKWVANTHELESREAYRYSQMAKPCVHHPVGPNDSELVIDLQSPHEQHQNYVTVLRRFVEQHCHAAVEIENF